jgi:long-chain acyl-CoA synthetase
MKEPWKWVHEKKYFKPFEYDDKTVVDYLERSVKKYPDNVALIFMGKKITYREMWEMVLRLAAALADYGVKKGDRVAISFPNIPQSAVSFFAVAKTGAIMVQINPLYVEREIRYILEDSGARTYIALDLLRNRIRAAAEGTAVERFIYGGIIDYLPALKKPFYKMRAKKSGMWSEFTCDENEYRFTTLLDEHAPRPTRSAVDKDDLIAIQYTSATTGLPKGVMLTHQNLAFNVRQTESIFVNSVHGQERFIGLMPFFHAYGMTLALCMAVYMGDAVILVPRFDADMLIEAISKYKANYFPGVPTMYVALLNHPKVGKMRIDTLKGCFSGAAPMPMDVIQKFEALTGGKIVEGYGLTEASPVTHANTIGGPRKPGSVGVPKLYTTARIMDIETGTREVPIGEIGEICVKGPQVMKGYWNNPEATREVLRNGWLYTGDIGKMDEEGFFYVVDRKKDMIIAGGYNIYPREIDEVLYTHPKVKNACAVGIPDPYRGETVKAFVQLKEGETATEQEIIKYCKDNMAAYKVPKIVEFRDELPVTAVGKVLRKKLREEEQPEEKMGH